VLGRSLSLRRGFVRALCVAKGARIAGVIE